MDKYYVGIDTSNYTTSLAVIDAEGNTLIDLRKILEVKKNQVGLRQQDAVFQHMKNLPLMIGKLSNIIDPGNINTISVSVAPRTVKDSYMPVFQVGKGQAFILSSILKKPLKQFSHQEGHISSGMLNSPLEDEKRFFAFHLSGGTTELLLIDNEKDNFDINIIGGTKDLNIGQLIDRIGVEIGIGFPCGKELDYISQKGKRLNLKLPMSTHGTWANFSGMENYFKKIYGENRYYKEDIANTLFYCISQFIIRIVLEASYLYDVKYILFIGGVSSNSIIRDELLKGLNYNNIKCYFPNTDMCTDNGVGIANLGRIKKGHVWEI